MARYTAESKERVREAVDMAEIVGARTELRRASASEMIGLCPFHDERTPSFHVNPVEKIYYCFGCQARGDVFTFVQELEGLDFVGALEMLAERSGVELAREAEDPGEARRRQRRERLLALLDRTARYYSEVLWRASESARAREYLVERGLGESVLREFRVGYAPSGYDRVLLASQRSGFSEEELRAAGLAQRSRQDGRLYDRFRGRLMFPLTDMRGKVLGFGARAMRENQQPKYLNTADGEVYHKGRHLYGADVARAHAARAGEAILCEGYTDVIALHGAGVRNAVGLMGTALTDEQVGELARLAPTVLLALDADGAGIAAMLKAAALAERRRLAVRVIALPAGTDPAELAQREGAEAVRELVAHSVPFVRFRVEQLLARGELDSADGRDRVLAELRPVFAELGPSAMQQELLALVSGRLGLGESVMASLLEGSARRAPGPAAQGGGETTVSRPDGGPRPPRPRALDRREAAERHFLALCIAQPGEGARALAALEPETHFTSALVRRAAVHLREHLDAPAQGLPAGDEELAGLITELTVRAGGQSPTRSDLEIERLQLDLGRIDRAIQAARLSQAPGVATLAAEREQVRRAIDDAMDRALRTPG